MAIGYWHWSVSWPALLCYAVVAPAHLVGLLRQLRMAEADSVAVRKLRTQAVAFQGGLALALLALVSPIEYLSAVYIWVRALQFLLLALVATGLIVLGAPWRALVLAIRPRAGGTGVLGKRPVPGIKGSSHRIPWLLAHPALTVTAVNVVWLSWQLPALYDAASTNGAVAVASHVTCLAAGVLFWLQLIGSQPLRPKAAPLRRFRFVVGTTLAMAILGMVLVFGSGMLYPVYANSAHHVMTLVDDQQLSGAVLWMGSLVPLAISAVALLMEWLSAEESADLSAGLDRLLTPRTNAWSARSGVR